jgi:hypothetical protein
LVEIWKTPSIESEIFLILGNLDNPQFLEIFTLLPLFNDRKKNFMGRQRHPYELGEKKTAQKRALDEEVMHKQF